MFVVRSEGGRLAAAYLDEQFPGQEWLPIDSRLLQAFLAAAPSPGRLAGLRHRQLRRHRP
jgi:hypothetical protein